MKEEVLYKIVAMNSDYDSTLPHRIRTILNNDISGYTYYSYDYKKRRYISCFINDNFDIYDRLVEKDKEIERLNNILNELEKWLNEIIPNTLDTMKRFAYMEVLDKLKELKGE